MEIIYGVNTPVQVGIKGSVSGGNKRRDLLINGEVFVVFPLRPTAKMNRPSAAVRVQDAYNGEVITVQGFNGMADEIAALRPGNIVHAYGTASRYRGKQLFTVTELLDESPTVYKNLAEFNKANAAERELQKAPPALPNENLSFRDDELEPEEVAAGVPGF